jgi:hypothetical protein
MGSVRPARRFDAHRALAIRGLPSRPKSDGGPPCAFALLQRSIAAPPHRPADREAGTSDDASSPGLPCRTTHDGAADPHLVGLPAPRRAASGVSTPIAASTTVPPGALRHRSVPRLPPARRSPRADRDSFRSPLPSWRCSRRFASPPWGACGRGRLQGLDPGVELVLTAKPLRVSLVDAFVGFVPSEHSLLPSVRALCVALAPPPRVGRFDVPSRLRLEVLWSGRPG